MISVHFIITAAGMSRRHPPNKLLETIHGKTVIEATVRSFLSTGMDITVVTGYEHEKIAAIINNVSLNVPGTLEVPGTLSLSDVTTVYNPDYESGLASSVKTGIGDGHDRYAYWGFCNGDKPFIQPRTVMYLLEKLEELRPLILVPTYRNENGHPTFFSTGLREEFLKLTGDSGGRQILKNLAGEILYLPVDDPGIVTDMDAVLGDRQEY